MGHLKVLGRHGRMIVQNVSLMTKAHGKRVIETPSRLGNHGHVFSENQYTWLARRGERCGEKTPVVFSAVKTSYSAVGRIHCTIAIVRGLQGNVVRPQNF
jgi:hypothetical protein